MDKEVEKVIRKNDKQPAKAGGYEIPNDDDEDEDEDEQNDDMED